MPESVDALVVGSVNMDLMLEVERAPRPGETVLARAGELRPGGKGANQAVAARRLGLDVRFVGLVGDDALGRQLRQGLREEGIDVAALGESAGISGMAAISLTPDGENAITVAAGANARLEPGYVLALPDDAFACRALLLQLEIPLDAALAAARRARRAGASVLLNPSPVPLGGAAELLAATDWLACNRAEAEALTGHRDPGAAAQALLALGPAAVFVTLGARGAIVAAGAETRLAPAPPVAAVDTTGAGDAFMGALAYAICRRGPDPFAAAPLAVAAGAAATRRRGAQAALPYLEELAALGATPKGDRGL